jgi:hypothetical protein|tara:strand:+ start:674 stop:1105 length:432 start_codon:yes stop_codon:yes gene_type:complete
MKTYTINGRQCIDATKSMTLNITNNDCTLASRKDHANCVISRACMKSTGSDALVYVSRVYIKQTYQDVWVRYIVTNTLRTQVVAFDQGGDFAEGTYTLHAPNSCKRLGVSTGGHKAAAIKTPRRMPIKLEGVRTAGHYGKIAS